MRQSFLSGERWALEQLENGVRTRARGWHRMECQSFSTMGSRPESGTGSGKGENQRTPRLHTQESSIRDQRHSHVPREPLVWRENHSGSSLTKGGHRVRVRVRSRL